jgi:hypothetical protein
MWCYTLDKPAHAAHIDPPDETRRRREELPASDGAAAGLSVHSVSRFSIDSLDDRAGAQGQDSIVTRSGKPE